jgi:putative ABC transport system permease protein
LEQLLRDLRYGARSLLRSRTFAAVSVIVLALAIGANTAVFSLINSVLLRPLPYSQPDRLLMLPAHHVPDEMGAEVAPGTFADWRRMQHSFADVGAYAFASLNLTSGDSPERLQGSVITPGALAAVGVRPILGRLFLPGEEGTDARFALLSYGLWRSHFGADPGILGRVVRLDGIAFPVVGVMPPDFHFPRNDVTVWIPLRLTPERLRNREDRWTYVIGRLAPGVSLTAAQREMDGISRELARQFPRDNADWGVRLVPLQTYLVGGSRAALLILFATVLLVLLIGCANLANLQLVRGAGRRREIAIRSAMGATPSAMLRQLAVESLLLALCGGALGLLLARWALTLLGASGSRYLPRLEEVRIDPPVLLFTLLLAVVTGVLFGVAPGLGALRPDLAGTLRESGRGASGSAHQNRLRQVLTLSEISIALALLIGAGLLLGSLQRLQSVDPGFKPENVVTLDLVLPAVKTTDNARMSAYFRELMSRVRSLPGVQAAGAAYNLPLAGGNMTESFALGAAAPPNTPNLPEAGFRGITPGYFAALRIPLLQGRDFTDHDRADTPKVVVVNRAFVRRYWPHDDPLGQRLYLDGNSLTTVVGVAGDVKHESLDEPTKPAIYVCYEQQPFDAATLVVRTAASPASMLGQLRSTVHSYDPDQPVFNARTMTSVLAASTSSSRFYSSLLSFFAGLSLLLALLGVYGTISYGVSQRRQEIGIRMALGASHQTILRLVVGEAAALAFAGVGVGLVLAFALTRSLRSLLFGISASDPTVFLLTSVALTVGALGASFLPARKASRINPVIALRQD